MKRLVAIPLFSLAACTITVAPIKDKQQEKDKHQAKVKHAQVAKKPTPKPSPKPFPQQIHEQYQPLYEKLPPSPTVNPTP